MPSRVTSCPNCGGQVEFKAGTSLLTVCPYCSSAVARVGDDISELELLGQVAPLADLGSPLSLGVSGKYRGKGFTLVGQLQLDYGEGPWNEWYAAFDDGRWGWIAEAQGRAYVTFGRDVPGLPSFREARVGSRFSAANTELLVVERRRAEFKAAQGELPFAVAPGSHFQYADVQGPNGVFGTVDYGTGQEAEALFLGEELPYGELFDKSVLREVAPGEAAAAVGLNCPNCGASVELRAPDDAQRVGCGTCGSLLDASKGNELYLLTALQRPGPEPIIPLGSKGRFDGKTWEVYGHLHRSVTFDGVRYAWEEYLLHGGVKEGYRWLSCSDGHWTWVDPVHGGDIQPGLGRGIKHDGETFMHYSSASARVDAVRGEFYWKVAIGERVNTADYIKPPRVLSREEAANEVNWSVGRYLQPAEVQEAFKLKDSLPQPFGIAPHMPNLRGPALKGSLMLGVAFSVLLGLVAALMAVTSDNEPVLEQSFNLTPEVLVSTAKKKAPKAREKGALVQTERFELSGRTNVAIKVTADVSNTWLFLGGELVNLTTNQTFPLGIQVNHASGYSGGSSWGRGGRERTVFLGDLPGGPYVMRFTPQWSTQGKAPTRYTVRAVQDVFVGTHAVVVFFVLWILPLWVALAYYAFEKRRWADSDHAG